MANSLERFDLQQQISSAMNGLRKEMADIGGATTPEMKAAARTLASSIRKVVGVKAKLYAGPRRPGQKLRGIPSAPGEPPRRVTSKLYKAVGTEIVGGITRVGDGWFTSRLLELGVDATLPTKSGKIRRRKGGIGRRRIKIAPRPFMQRALNAAQDKMGDQFAVTLQKRIEGGGSIRVG